MRPRHGIFCIEEADWWLSAKEQSSVVSVLELLRQPPISLPFVRGDVGTREEFSYYLRKWKQKKYYDYDILYIATHGRPGQLMIGETRRGGVSLEELAEELEGSFGVVHLGGCGVLNVSERRILAFLARTKAVAVRGYGRVADWVAAAGFELLLFSELERVELTPSGLKRARERLLRNADGLAQSLRFKMFVKGE